MNAIFSLLLSCALLSGTVYGEEPLIQPVSAEQMESVYQMAIVKGKAAELSARQLEIRLGLPEGELEGITITDLPDSGGLFLDGARLSEFSQLSREELDRLCFLPGESALQASFSFIPDCSNRTTATLSITVADQLPAAPSADDLSLRTWSGIFVQTAPLFEGDTQTAAVRMTRAPQKGVAKTDGITFSYQPFSGLSGEDSFSYVLEDAYGNLSDEATVSVTIQENANGFFFADMAGRSEAAAAITLHKNDILCGEKIGAGWYFHPDVVMTRGQFLICLLSAKNTPLPAQAVIRTGLSNDGELPLWLKPYLQSALGQKILTENAFHPEEPITSQEADRLLHRAFDPTWQKSALSSLFAAMGQMDQDPATAPGKTPLTRAACAEMLVEMTNNFPS
ncbi:MAG: Ig-like domain-containing protein [Oscillospiraceae bacterium]|nr:Ig-like domain-containing protein [Oscillospiraceae bacterium]